MNRNWRPKLLFFALLFSALGLCGCSYKSSETIELDDKVYIAPCMEGVPVEGIIFQKLDTREFLNIARKFGTKGQFLWLKIDFDISEGLKDKDLALVISYLHFSDEVFINGHFAGRTGQFPPNEQSRFYAAHSYNFPKEFLNRDSQNTILIKLWAHGFSNISHDIFVEEVEAAKYDTSFIDFFNTRVYLDFEGIMFCAMILFFIIHLYRKKEGADLVFALLNLSSIFFLTAFFAPVVPWFTNHRIPYFQFYKFILCIPFYFVVYFNSLFILKYLGLRPNNFISSLRLLTLLAQITVTIAASDYDILMKICPAMLGLSCFEILSASCYHLASFFNKEKRRKAIVLCAGLSFSFAGFLIDLVLRVGFKNNDVPFISLPGFQLTILAFVVILARSFGKLYFKNEELNLKLVEFNRELEDKVRQQTRSLTIANEELAHKIEISEADLEMASIVQQKFFPLPDRKFRGWDIAVCYQPVSRVSGDMFDFYSTDGKLNGVSLFDVSGHGISASLITMLSKGIIYRAFQKCSLKNLPVSQALKQINFHVNNEKGDIENYLTGLMFRFGDFDKNDSCSVKMSNAGHPHPIMYRRKEDKVSEISQSKDQKHYGAIGISGIEVSFPDIEYKMNLGDVLVYFTDGLTETENSRREQFGSRRVAEVLWKNKNKTAAEILAALKEELNSFHPDSLLEDDLTIIVLKRIESAGYAEENSSLIEELPVL